MKTVRIAITGLRRSGKTVFMTSWVNQLLNPKEMKNFPKKQAKWPVKAEILPLPKNTVPFPYEKNLQALKKDSPEWPEPTTVLSEIHLKLSYKNTQKGHNKYNTLKLELVDYPGEWIVDLPLMRLPFHEWSKRMLVLAEEKYREQFSEEWLQLLETIDPAEPPDDKARNLVLAYKKYLETCREKIDLGLMNLQPGHYLNIPRGLEEDEVFDFCPLPIPSAYQYTGNANLESALYGDIPTSAMMSQSLFGVFEKRYERFRRDIIRPFYKKCFKNAKVQIVLIDVLETLRCGLESYNDHRKCIEEIINMFKFGKRAWFLGPLLPSHIEKTIFVATKADHSTKSQHANLKGLIEDIVEKAQDIAVGEQLAADVGQTYISSVCSTIPYVERVNGRDQSVLKGIRIGHEEKGYTTWNTGEVPSEFPPEEWELNEYEFYKFLPDKFPAKNGTPVSHINLDLLLGSALDQYL